MIYKNLLSKEDVKALMKKVNSRFKDTVAINAKECNAHADVYRFGKDKVVRVEHVVDKEGSGYAKYVEKIVLNSKSKHVPKIYFHALLKPTEYGCTGTLVTVMEKLYHARGKEQANTTLQIENVYICGILSLDDITCKKAKRAIKYLESVAEKKHLYLNDLHEKNLMFREDGTLVVTDPIP